LKYERLEALKPESLGRTARPIGGVSDLGAFLLPVEEVVEVALVAG